MTIVAHAGTQTTILASSASDSAYGEMVSFTAIVAPLSGVGTPTGDVVFMDGSTVIGSSPVFDSLAVFKTTALAVGTHPIVAVYEGDGFVSNSQSLASDQTVSPAHTTTTLSAVESANHRGIVLDAKVIPNYPGAGLPSGSVKFAINGRPFRTVRLVNGQAQLNISNQNAFRKRFSASFLSKSISYIPSTAKPLHVMPKHTNVHRAAHTKL